MLAGLLDIVDAAILSLPNVTIHSSTEAAVKKQESKGSVSCTNPPFSALSEWSCNSADIKGSTSASLLCKTGVLTTPAPLAVLADRIPIKILTVAASISLNRCDIAVSYSPRLMLDSCSSIRICLICTAISSSSSRNGNHVSRDIGRGLSGTSVS